MKFIIGVLISCIIGLLIYITSSNIDENEINDLVAKVEIEAFKTGYLQGRLEQMKKESLIGYDVKDETELAALLFIKKLNLGGKYYGMAKLKLSE